LDALLPYWNQAVVDPLIAVLQFLANVTSSGGLAIILMTLIIKTVLLPLSLKQTASMKAMQSVQPELAAIKKKFKDREKVTQETMKLYKERGINPASGCVPMIPTMVVLFGLYGALQTLSQHDPEFQEAFLWMPGLNHPDVIHLGELALPGILPIAMAITQFFSSRMMTMPSADPQQQTMNRMTTVIMPGMMLFWGLTFPAGLVLYWFVSNVYEMVRLYFTMGPDSLKLGSFSFASLLPGRDQPSPDGNGMEPTEDIAEADIPRGGASVDGRPARRRQKRGKRSGRR
jgi:YidC/Oxa1 family membrane protein insertase